MDLNIVIPGKVYPEGVTVLTTAGIFYTNKHAMCGSHADMQA